MRKSDSKPTRGERIYDFGKKFGTEFLSESIHIDDFSAHVAKLHSDGDIGFANEYEEIQSFCKKTIVVGIPTRGAISPLLRTDKVSNIATTHAKIYG